MSTGSKLPLQVWILTLSAFAIGTAEFVIAGLLTQIADDLAITEGQAGQLITVYAMAIVIGGPILTLWLARFDKRNVLLGLMGLFIAGNVMSAFAGDYAALLISRIIAGLTLANVPAMQMRVMTFGRQAPELAATANISAFNIANALGGIIGAAVVDSTLGAQAIPFAAALVPILGVLFILTQERKRGSGMRCHA